MNEAIIEYIKRKFSMLIGEQTAEKIKLDLGSATMPTERKEMEVRGRDATGLPRSIVVEGTELEFVIMVIAVSCVKLLSAHNSTQHTSRKHKV
jgi:rod shape-determining protein MreB